RRPDRPGWSSNPGEPRRSPPLSARPRESHEQSSAFATFFLKYLYARNAHPGATAPAPRETHTRQKRPINRPRTPSILRMSAGEATDPKYKSGKGRGGGRELEKDHERDQTATCETGASMQPQV